MGGKSHNRSSRTADGRPTGQAADAAGAAGSSGTSGGHGGDGPGCDIHLDVDLAGVRSDVVAGLSVGDVLDVALRPLEGYDAVACLDRPGGRIAGTLANVEGLDRMIGCLRAGHRYRATVVDVGALRCRVLVDPVPA